MTDTMPDQKAATAIVLGVDLQLVIDKSSVYTLRALNAQGGVLGVLGRTAAYPSDAEFTAARAVALLLFAEHVYPADTPKAQPAIKPHPYERVRPSERTDDAPWACRHCPHDARHAIHTTV